MRKYADRTVEIMEAEKVLLTCYGRASNQLACEAPVDNLSWTRAGRVMPQDLVLEQVRG